MISKEEFVKLTAKVAAREKGVAVNIVDAYQKYVIKGPAPVSKEDRKRFIKLCELNERVVNASKAN